MVTLSSVRDRLRDNASELYVHARAPGRRATKADLEAAANEMSLAAQALTTWLLRPAERGEEEPC